MHETLIKLIPIGTKTEPKFQLIGIKKFPEREKLMKKWAKIGKSSRSGHFVKFKKQIVKFWLINESVCRLKIYL